MKKLLNKIKEIRKENKVYYTNFRKWNKENKTKGVKIFDYIFITLWVIILTLVLTLRVVEENNNLKIKNQLAESEVIEIKTRKEKKTAQTPGDNYTIYCQVNGDYDSDENTVGFTTGEFDASNYFDSDILNWNNLKAYLEKTYPNIANNTYNLYQINFHIKANSGYYWNMASTNVYYALPEDSNSVYAYMNYYTNSNLTGTKYTTTVVTKTETGNQKYEYTINKSHFYMTQLNMDFNFTNNDYEVYGLPDNLYYSLENQSYLLGYETAKQEYEAEIDSLKTERDYYSELYRDKASDYDDLEADGLNMNEMITTTIETPLNVFKDIFNFSILGVNLWQAAAAIVSILFIVWFVKKVH